MFLPMDPLVVYLTPMKWLWNPHVEKPENNIMGMDMCKIIEQMGKNNLENQAKIITPEKWLTVTPNLRC